MILKFAIALLFSALGFIPVQAGDFSAAQVKPGKTSSRYQKSVQAFHQIPNIELVTMNGQKIKFSQLVYSGQPVILDFIFASCPTFCPLLSATFAKAQQLAADEDIKPKFISITIDPENDTPKKLKAYAEKFHAGPDWHFLTGEFDQITALQQAFSAFYGDKISHRALIFVNSGQPGSDWLRLEGFSSASNLLAEYRNFMAKTRAGTE